MTNSFAIQLLQRCVPGLDTLLGGGIAEYTLNIIAGTLGSGKTTLAHELVFSPSRTSFPAIYFFPLGEAGLKILRHQQLVSFVNIAKVDTCLHLMRLPDELAEGDLERALSRILHEVKQHLPRLVVIDCLRHARKFASGLTRTATSPELLAQVRKKACMLTAFCSLPDDATSLAACRRVSLMRPPTGRKTWT